MSSLSDKIKRVLGFAPERIKPVGITRFPTSNRAGNLDGWVKVMRDGSARFGCWRRGIFGTWNDDWDGSRHVRKIRDEYATKKSLMAEENRLERQGIINRKIFSYAKPIIWDSPVGQYLSNRGLGDLCQLPDVLHMACQPYYDAGFDRIGDFPVMLGAVTCKVGSLVALHRTYVTEDGFKAPVPSPKKLSRLSGKLSGASIKLFEPFMLNGKLTLGVGEGIETALASFLMFGVPTWACVSASGMRSFEWPDDLESLVIFADNDASGVGQAAARELATRAAAAGLEVRVATPPFVGSDWLDIYSKVAKR